MILLVIALESLRRAGKEYDRYLLRRHQKTLAAASAVTSSSVGSGDKDGVPTVLASQDLTSAVVTFRPGVLQQAVRALIHMSAFAVAYFVMLCVVYLVILGLGC